MDVTSPEVIFVPLFSILCILCVNRQIFRYILLPVGFHLDRSKTYRKFDE